jgi:glycogen(starch) synthase
LSAGRLRICLISQEFPPYTNWGGIAVYNGALAAAYAALGHDVVVVSRTSPGAPADERRNGARVVRVGAPIARKRFVGRTVDRMLHARDVRATVRSLDQGHPFDILETTEAGLEGEQLVRDESFRRRLIVQCNGSNEFGEAAGGPLAPLHRIDWAWSFRREQRVLRQVPQIIVTSEATRAVLARQGLADSRIVLIPQGIDTIRFSPDGRVPRSGPLRVGFVGRLEKRKGIDFIWLVIDRLAATGDYEFHLKGALHPATRADTERRLTSYGDTVRHHGPGSHDDMPAFYRQIDVLLQPSRFENFGLAYAEAMASGVLVLAGRRGGGGEIITDGATGFLVDPDGPVEQATRVLERLAGQPAAFASVIAAGRDEIVARFSLDRCAARKLELYWKVAQRP